MKRLVLLLVTVLFSALALAAVNINTANLAELEALPPSELGAPAATPTMRASSDSAAAARPH